MVGRSFKPAGVKAAQPQAAAPQGAVASGNAAGGKGTQPSHILKFKNPETGKYERLTGLFVSESKDGGSFLKGMDKNSGVTYIVVTNDYNKPSA